ncbi:MAG: WD40 repeat domain-containing protein [Chloroflexota bacterium]|nr:hypothetical protein [Chloroflexota bacterium]MBI5703834.1 hypothetical protein [Chloroflexota bacterium]
MVKKALFSIVILALFMAACASINPETQASVITPLAEPVKTEPNPTLPPSTSIPTEAATIAPTVVPTVTATSIPWASTPLGLDNANQIKEITRWGLGSVWRTYYTKANQALVLTSLGLYIYQVEPVTLLVQIDLVDDFVVSPDEKWLVVSKDSTVEIWDLSAKALYQRIERAMPQAILDRMEKHKLEKKYVAGMAIAPDSTEIAIGYIEGVVDLWKIGQDTPYASLNSEYFALGPEDYTLTFLMKYAPDGKSLAIARAPIFTTYTRLTFWMIPDGTLITISEPARFVGVPDLNFAPEMAQIITIEEEESFKILGIWDALTGKRLAKIKTGLAVIYTESMELASNGEQIHLMGRDSLDNLYQQSWSIPDGKRIENTKLTELPQNERETKFQSVLLEKGHYQTLWAEGDGWAHSQVQFLDNQSFRLTLQNHWLTLPGPDLQPFNLPEENLRPYYYDFQNQSLAWCKNHTLYWKDKADNTKVIDLPGLTSCEGVIISPKQSFAAGWDNHVYALVLVNLKTGKTSRYQQKHPHRTVILSAVFTDDEKYLLLSGGALAILNLEPELTQINRQAGTRIGFNLYPLFLKNNEDFAALNGNDVFSTRKTSDIYSSNRIVVWNAFRLEEVRNITPPWVDWASLRVRFSGFALSPDESLLATGDDFGYVRLWDLRAQKEIFALEFDYKPVALAFAPDGSGLLVVLADGTIRLLGVP